jgi:Cu-Zn family superoxide dismutase
MERYTKRVAAVVGSICLLGVLGQGSGGASNGATHATAEIVQVTGTAPNQVTTVIGFANFTEDGTGRVHVNVKVDGLSPGLHGIHIHNNGNCDSITGPHSGAGGHVDHEATGIHGEHNPAASDGTAPEGYHAGDLPNLVVNGSGRGTLNGTTNGATLTVGLSSLLDANGSAIVIHADPDNLMTNPIGNSGTRIACGIIIAG